MSKRRFIQSRDPPYDFIEVGDEYVESLRSIIDASLWNDRSYDGLRATDGTAIDTRSKQREYMKRNNLTTADDYKNEWTSAERGRDDYRTGKKGTVTRHDVARAIATLENKR